jgi:dTDP-4-dehydrorhamnose reductase
LKLDSAKVLVTGGSGSLGWALSRKLASVCEVTSTFASHAHVPDGTTGINLDLAQRESLKEVVHGQEPDVIFHLAAMTNPDECEKNPRRALRINFEGTLELAQIARSVGSRLVFVSTDLVFDGLKGDYREEDTPRPLSIYGMSKLRAEESVLETSGDNVVLRSSLIYGMGSKVSRTFLSRVLETLASGEKMRLFTDQKRNPILVDDVAEALVGAVGKDLKGLYHIGGKEVVTRYEFGRTVCRVFGYDEDLLVPIKMEDFDYSAKRPLDSTLNIDRFMAATGFRPTGIIAALRRLS